MTLEATCCPDAVRAGPLPAALPEGDQLVARADQFTCVEDALTAGLALPCQDVDPDLFFAETPAEVELAKALCTDCPVRLLCRSAAEQRQEPWGVWGGEWFVAGVAVDRKRPRGRPRKDGSVGPRPVTTPLTAPRARKEVAA